MCIIRNNEHTWLDWLNNTIPIGTPCDCGLTIYESYEKEFEVPIGVSQWKEYGIKYGYWSYFEKQYKEEIIKILKKQLYLTPSIGIKRALEIIKKK